MSLKLWIRIMAANPTIKNLPSFAGSPGNFLMKSGLYFRQKI